MVTCKNFGKYGRRASNSWGNKHKNKGKPDSTENATSVEVRAEEQLVVGRKINRRNMT